MPNAERLSRAALIVVGIVALWALKMAWDLSQEVALLKAFAEDATFDEAVIRCNDNDETSPPFDCRRAKRKWFYLGSMKNPVTGRDMPYMALVAGHRLCAYFPFTKRTQIGMAERWP
jgi:hypothetical protein